MSCGCPDAQIVDKTPSSSTAHLSLVEQEVTTPNGSRLGLESVISAALPNMPQAAHLQPTGRPGSGMSRPVSSDPRTRGQGLPSPDDRERPIHLLRHPSFNPPAFDADDPPPPIPADLLTPPPTYDVIVGTPSVDGLADYFARLAVYEGPGAASRDGPGLGDEEDDPLSSNNQTPLAGGSAPGVDPFDRMGTPKPDTVGPTEDDSSDSADEEDPARPHRRGRVNVANPRTPGGRLIPSRSLEIERPVVRLDMTGVIRRDG